MFSLKIVKGAELAEGVKLEVLLPETFSRFGIGRDPANQWAIPDRTLAISARHCEFVSAGGRVLLRDLSTNGTFINGVPQRLAKDHVLCDGDRIELGPYTVEVQGHGADAGRGAPADSEVTVQLPPAEPAMRTPSVETTAPLRGGDPAAMLVAAARAPAPQVGLTEILRNAQPLDEAKVTVTKIRVAPKPPAPPAPVTEAPPRGLQAGAPPDALAALALGLGLDPEALAGRNPMQVTLQVAALARAAVGTLHLLLEQQAQARRQIGSHAMSLAPVRDFNPLRRAASPDAALAALLEPGADVEGALHRAGEDMSAHHERLLAAFRGAAQRMGQAMAPAALEQALGEPAGGAQSARLWDAYTQLWHGLGLAPGQPWPQGFVEAASLHLAAAYDEQGPR